MQSSSKKGFTLIEMLMTIVIVGVISVVLGQILFQSYETFVDAQNASAVDWQGYIAMERIANDIHNIRSSTDITTAQSAQLSFVNMSNATVTYQLSGTTLLRNGVALATGISSLNFIYYDQNGATTGTTSSVRYIAISFNVTSSDIVVNFATTVGTKGVAS